MLLTMGLSNSSLKMNMKVYIDIKKWIAIGEIWIGTEYLTIVLYC